MYCLPPALQYLQGARLAPHYAIVNMNQMVSTPPAQTLTNTAHAEVATQLCASVVTLKEMVPCNMAGSPRPHECNRLF
jgi:hypothetical protein